MEYLADTAAYGRRVMELFDSPAHAGPPDGVNLVGEAESRTRLSRIRLHLRVSDDVVEAAGFEALGCPHTIAAAELACEDLEGRKRDELAGYDARFLEAALPLPAEKLDIRILVEDAVRNAAAGVA
ncbi:MAG TPA: iron-sulfur cluster assembly scaffold protein [Gammaproteobacteria bacterium]